MSIDTTFHPITETYAVDNSAAVQIKGAAQRGATTFRIRPIAVTGGQVVYVAWGPQAAGLVATPPTLGSPSPNTICINALATVVIEVPPNSFFIANTAFTTPGGVEITGGIGGQSS